MIKNKRGQEGGPGTTVSWVIALLILVIAGFAIWWAYTTFKGGTFPWQKSTITLVAQACTSACVGSDKAGYCAQDRTITLSAEDYKKFDIKGNETDLENQNISIDINKRSLTASCEEFSSSIIIQNWIWGIEMCEQLDC